MAGPDPSQVTRLLARAGGGDPKAAEDLLPLLYDHLRSLAKRNMSDEPAGHTLQPTALVHEAYLRLVGDGAVNWNSRGHFYGAAAQAMRRILVERARRKSRAKHGGGLRRLPLTVADPAILVDDIDFVGLDGALDALQTEHPRPAKVVMLRYFGGLTEEQIATTLDVSRRTVQGDWKFARVWLLDRIQRDGEKDAAEVADHDV